MTGIRDVIQQSKRTATQNTARVTDDKVTLLAVDYTKSTAVKGRPGYKWACGYPDTSNVFQVYAPNLKDRIGLPATVSKTRKPPFFRRIATGIDWNRMDAEVAEALTKMDPHAPNHEWPEGAPGDDAISIYPRALVPLSLRLSSGMFVFVSPGIYRFRGQSIKYPGELLNLASYVPSAGTAVRLAIYINPATNTATVETTAEVPSTQSPPYELVTKNVLYIGWVRIQDDTSAIIEAIINEPRAFQAVDVSGFETILDAGAQDADLLDASVEGDAYWATDTKMLYVFDGTDNVPVASAASGVSGGVLKGQVFG